MLRSKLFTAAFAFAALTVIGRNIPLLAAEQEPADCYAEAGQFTDTYEVYSAGQLAAVLNGSCADSAYRTMYERGRIHITMKNVSALNGGETYSLSSNVAIAEGKQFVLDMNGLDLYASGQDGQGIGNPVISVPSSSSLSVQSSWVDSSIRNISIYNYGNLKLDGTDMIPSVGQAIFNAGTTEFGDCNLYAGANASYAVVNDGGTMIFDGGNGADLSTVSGIYSKGSTGNEAVLLIKNGFHITDTQGHAVVNDGGFLRIGELAQDNNFLIDGTSTGVLTVNNGKTEMFGGEVNGGDAAVCTAPNTFSSVSSGATQGSFSMIGGRLSGSYGVVFPADSYVQLKAGQVKGEQAAVASVSLEGALTENIASYQFYNTDSAEADAYYYDESEKRNILCKEINNGKIVNEDNPETTKPSDGMPASETAEPSDEMPVPETAEPSDEMPVPETAEPSDEMPVSEAAEPSDEMPVSETAEPSDEMPVSEAAEPLDGMPVSETEVVSDGISASERAAPLNGMSVPGEGNPYDIRDGTVGKTCFAIRDGTVTETYFDVRGRTG